ncbi:hypothetical protein ACRE_087750 [Hapsidospora chrysogenum ATCC 11550]|uniref:Uncharacterized protein n=1 Tax=Hapsidospora chrysogenum (strain ATCC 11550 / CBS 779.69 / DSM 880 / IAM 14645 / JCM 23072 / IMI 49137) TaxID=857340 RepID=A0A086STV9_HAPC1|nr:hypothetical protein ACRE_087750 [Hapsidospora chrysogenum ATCC 11550]
MTTKGQRVLMVALEDAPTRGRRDGLCRKVQRAAPSHWADKGKAPHLHLHLHLHLHGTQSDPEKRAGLTCWGIVSNLQLHTNRNLESQIDTLAGRLLSF